MTHLIVGELLKDPDFYEIKVVGAFDKMTFSVPPPTRRQENSHESGLESGDGQDARLPSR